LYELNKIWRSREKNVITRVQSNCNREISDIKRKQQMKEPYDDVMVKRKIARLEEDLKRARKEINKLAIENKSKIRGDIGSENVKSSLKLMNEFQLDKKRLEEELNFYKNKNHEYETRMITGEDEKISIMDGMNFMGNKLRIEIDTFEKKYMNNLRQVSNTLNNTDIETKLKIEKILDNVTDDLQDLKKRVDNAIQLNQFNKTSTLKTKKK